MTSGGTGFDGAADDRASRTYHQHGIGPGSRSGQDEPAAPDHGGGQGPSFEELPCALADAISEAVAWPPDPRTRAETICSLAREVYATAAWLHRCDHNHVELVSLRRLVAAADAHWLRMRLGDDEAAGEHPTSAQAQRAARRTVVDRNEPSSVHPR